MRARNIKPGFFLNCELSEVDFATRLLFIGLWCYADREGRFLWKPKQIKAAIFPYDNVNIDKLLKSLLSLHVITCIDNIGYVEHFKKHQHPHPHEAKSLLPEKPEQNQCHDMSSTLHVMSSKCQADIRIKDTIIPDIIIPDTLLNADCNFELFWQAYPKKVGKGDARKAWLKIKPSPSLQQMMSESLEKQKRSAQWQKSAGQFIPNPSTWLNQQRWEDDLTETVPFKTDRQLEADRIYREQMEWATGGQNAIN